jgi:hypothetical protein
MDAMHRDYGWTILSDTPTEYYFDNINLPIDTKKLLWKQKYPKELFLNAETMPGAISEFASIKKWAEKNDVKLICVTSQKPKLVKYTYIWLGKHDFTFEELYITKNKYEVKCDYLIDYSPKAYKSWYENGRKEDRFILRDSNINKNLNTTNRIKKLTDITDIVNGNEVMSN